MTRETCSMIVKGNLFRENFNKLKLDALNFFISTVHSFQPFLMQWKGLS